jgi:cell division protein FtsI (penicillin-binding protein 3)
MVKPLFVKGVVHNGYLVKEYKTRVLVEKICNEKTLAKVREMMEGVVIRGTGSKLRSPYYTAAGKTGTALVADKKHGYRNKIYRSSFCAYFPAENPKYTCFVMVNAPSKGVYYGAAVAGPVFKDLADKVYANSIHLHKELKFTYTSFTRDLPVVQVSHKDDLKRVLDQISISSHLHNDSISEHETDWMQADVQDNSLAIQPVKTGRGTMPDLEGMKAKDAIFIIEGMGAKVMVEGFGKVKKQSVKAGEKVVHGCTVKLQLG